MNKTPGEDNLINTKDRLPLIIKIAFGVFFAATIILMAYYAIHDKSDLRENAEPTYIEEWTITDPEGNVFTAGSTYRKGKNKLKGFYTMESTLPDTVRDGYQFCFIVGGSASVYVNGQLRTVFDEEKDVLFPGGCVKRFYMTVPLYDRDAGDEIRIVRKNSNRSGYLYQDTFVTTGDGLLHYLLNRYGLSFMLGEILFLFSFVIVLISVAMSLIYKRRLEMLYGAMSILVISGWLISNSYLCPFVYGHYHIDGIVNYLLCLMIPFNLVFYLDLLQHGRYHKVMNVVMIVATVNFLLWPILHFSEILPFPSALLYLDLVLGVLVLAVAVVLILEVIHRKVKDYKYTAIGFAFFFACCLAEIIMLNFVPILNDDVFMLLGLALLLTMAVVQQMSDLRKVRYERQKAVDLSEAKTRFLASMSHEIRTPINAVLGMNEMIIRENKDPLIDDYAQSVKSSGKMLLMLVNDVLDFSKIEAGKIEITHAAFSMSQLLHDIMPMLKERADEKRLKLETKIVSEVPNGQISDEFRIRQILINIINNAIKYTDSGSVTLSVGGEYEGDETFRLKLSIADTGRGISEEDQKHLFEAFTRADEKKNSNIEGTGLGLAIVKSIVDSMGGTITVNSKYREGSEFTIELSVGVQDRQPIKEDFLSGSVHKKETKERTCDYKAPDASILVVDDNKMNLKVVRVFLKQADITVDESESGLDAISKCKEKKYDLILLDHMMPEPDGIETLKIIRGDKDSLNKDTPSVVLTANALSDSRQMYMDAGFEDYLTKPLDISVLEQTVKKYIPEEKIIPV